MLSFFQMLDFTTEHTVLANQQPNQDLLNKGQHFHIPTFGIRVKLTEFSGASAKTVVREFKTMCEDRGDEDEIERRASEILDDSLVDLFEYSKSSRTKASQDINIRQSGTRKTLAVWDAPSEQVRKLTLNVDEFIWACRHCLIENQSLPTHIREELLQYWSRLSKSGSDSVIDIVSTFYKPSST